MDEKNILETWYRNPFEILDLFFSNGEHPIKKINGELILAEGNTAKQVLANKEGLFTEHSDFFTSSHGVFGLVKNSKKLAYTLNNF